MHTHTNSHTNTHLVVEDDPETGVYYIGRGCYPNKEGVVQLDAALMRGRDCSFGAVAGLERYVRGYWDDTFVIFISNVRINGRLYEEMARINHKP